MSHSTTQQVLQFKFKWLDDQGHETGFRSKQGWFDGETLGLDDVQLPVAVITQCEVRNNRVILAVLGENDEPVVFAFAVSSIGAEHLKGAINSARSATWAKYHQEVMDEKGLGHTVRVERCPRCHATLCLTNMPKTPQLYCHFCDSLMTLEPGVDVPRGEQDLKICDECGMFSSPTKFTIFYFYFLLVVYGFWQKTTWRCPACMRGDAWKMLFGNLLFLVGVPVALVQLVRSYRGSGAGGPFAGLDTANLKARKGDVMAALEIYRSILEQVPYSAGVKYNLGLALRQQNDLPRAAGSFEVALKDCSNYVPAYQALRECYQQMGETTKLAELEAMWSDGDEEAEEVDDLA